VRRHDAAFADVRAAHPDDPPVTSPEPTPMETRATWSRRPCGRRAGRSSWAWRAATRRGSARPPRIRAWAPAPVGPSGDPRRPDPSALVLRRGRPVPELWIEREDGRPGHAARGLPTSTDLPPGARTMGRSHVTIGAGYRLSSSRPRHRARGRSRTASSARSRSGLDLRPSESVAVSPVLGADVNLMVRPRRRRGGACLVGELTVDTSCSRASRDASTWAGRARTGRCDSAAS